MSLLLARIARSLTHHWLRGLAAAIVVIVLLGAAAGAGGEAADDFEIPGTESQQALDLFRAHSPAFAGADSTIVFSVDEGTLEDHAPAIESALAQVGELEGVDNVGDPFAEGAQMSEDGRIAAVDVRYTTDPADLEKEDGEALIAAAETAQGDGVQVESRGILIDLASEQEAPVGELIGVAIAIILLTLLFRSLAAMGATLIGALIGVAVGQILLTALAAPLGPAGLRVRHRGDARARRRHRLLPADHREIPRAGGQGRLAARRVREGRRDLRLLRRGRRRRGHGGHRRTARDRRPVHREARPRRGDRRRRGRDLRADDSPDHDRRVQEVAAPEEARARAAVAVLQPLGRDGHAAAVGRPSPRASSCS